MLIIDEYADAKLVKSLESTRSQAGLITARCIHFKPQGKAGETVGENIARQSIIASAERYVSSANLEIYLCEDGEVFILAPDMPIKNAKQLILDVAAQVHTAATDDFAVIYELSISLNKLLVSLEQKIEKKRDALMQQQKQLQKQREEEQLRRKRRMILDSEVKHTAHDIAQRRASRTAHEMMIIEDDAFSRRLVEKVLENRFSLTGLGSAEDALATYGRLAPDILFLDINLPDVTGHELLEKIIALDPQAYVVMLSGNADRENIMQAMNKGAKGFVAKPFSRDKLFQYIERCPTIHAKQEG